MRERERASEFTSRKQGSATSMTHNIEGLDGRQSSEMPGLNVFADVVLHSLTSRTELNGVKGRCVELKLEPLLGCFVVINGLAAKPELNGCRGKTLSFDEESDNEKGRYSVELDGTCDSYMIKT